MENSIPDANPSRICTFVLPFRPLEPVRCFAPSRIGGRKKKQNWAIFEYPLGYVPPHSHQNTDTFVFYRD